MANKRNNDLGVSWFAINKNTGAYHKHPFASTTMADRDTLKDCAERGQTWKQAQREIPYQSDEMRAVIQRFIDDGYGESLMSAFM